MKKILVIILIIISISGKSQNNEILTLFGVSSNVFHYDEASVFQLKYDKSLGKSIGIQVGIRSHSEIQKDIAETSKYIRYAYNSKKLNGTFLFSPLGNEKFKLKAGLGFDLGLSNYYWNWEGIIESKDDMNENNEIIKRKIYYWRYSIWNKVDVGMHFTLQANYYLRNNLFIAGELLYNSVFDRYVELPINTGGMLVRENPLCLSFGLGYRF